MLDRLYHIARAIIPPLAHRGMENERFPNAIAAMRALLNRGIRAHLPPEDAPPVGADAPPFPEEDEDDDEGGFFSEDGSNKNALTVSWAFTLFFFSTKDIHSELTQPWYYISLFCAGVGIGFDECSCELRGVDETVVGREISRIALALLFHTMNVHPTPRGAHRLEAENNFGHNPILDLFIAEPNIYCMIAILLRLLWVCVGPIIVRQTDPTP